MKGKPSGIKQFNTKAIIFPGKGNTQVKNTTKTTNQSKLESTFLNSN